MVTLRSIWGYVFDLGLLFGFMGSCRVDFYFVVARGILPKRCADTLVGAA